MTPNITLLDRDAPTVERPEVHGDVCAQLAPRHRCRECRQQFLAKLDDLLARLQVARAANGSDEALQRIWDLMDELAEDGVVPTYPGLAIAQCQQEIERQGRYVRRLELQVGRQRDIVEIALEIGRSRAIRTSATFAERFSRLKRAVQRYPEDGADV